MRLPEDFARMAGAWIRRKCSEAVNTFHELRKLHRDQFLGVKKVISAYWGLYGGWRHAITSPFFLIALIVHIVLFDSWTNSPWYEGAISILPSILGFVVAAYAILTAVTSPVTRFALSKYGDKGSPFMNLSTSFVHIIVVISSAILFALAAKAFHDESLSAVFVAWSSIAHLLFLYSICLIVGVGLSVFNITKIINKAEGNQVLRKELDAIRRDQEKQ